MNKWRVAEQKKLNQAIKARNQSAYNESDKIIKDLDGRISEVKSSPEYLTELQTELETLKTWRNNAKDKEQISTLDKDIANLEEKIESTQKPSAEIESKAENIAQEIISILNNRYGEGVITQLDTITKTNFEINQKPFKYNGIDIEPQRAVKITGGNENATIDSQLSKKESIVFFEGLEKANSSNYRIEHDIIKEIGEVVICESPDAAKTFVRTMELIQAESKKSSTKAAVDYQADITELEKEKSVLNKELDKATTAKNYKKADEIEKQISQVEEKIKSAQDDFENFKQNPEYLESLKADLKDNEEHLAKLKRQNREHGATSARNKHIKDTEKTISRLNKEIADIEKPAENEEVAVTAELEKATFKSPNTGKKFPSARLKNKVPDAEFVELLTFAKQHGGNYQRAAKGFVFKNTDERDAFISEVNGEAQQVEETAEPVQENNSAESQQIDETPRNYFNQLKKEIADLWKQRKAEQKRQLKAAESRDKKTFADSTTKLETLKNKIDSLTEEQTDFKNSPLYQQMLQDEIDDLKSFKQGLESNKDRESLQEIDKINKEILAKENDLKYYKNLSQVDEITENKNIERKKNVSRENYSSGVTGSQTTAETDSGAEIELQYKIVPATSLTTSHKLEGDDVFVNKNYPAKLQPRDREGEIERNQVIKMRNNLDTRRLGENIRLNEGAPTVRDDGTVLNGNGRAMAIESAYEEGKTDNYKQFLIDNAEKFGLQADDIAKIENPVLVREVTQELDDKTTNDIIKSKIGGVEFKVSEQAIADAVKLYDQVKGDKNFNSVADYVEQERQNLFEPRQQADLRLKIILKLKKLRLSPKIIKKHKLKLHNKKKLKRKVRKNLKLGRKKCTMKINLQFTAKEINLSSMSAMILKV